MNSSSTPQAKRLRNDPILWALFLVHGILAVLYLLPGSPFPEFTAFYEEYSLIPMMALGVLAPWLWLPKPESDREQVFWICWSAALASILLVRILYALDPELEQHNPGALTQDFLYVLFYLFPILSLQVKPDRAAPDEGRWPLHPLEAAGTGVFFLALLIYFVGIPHFLTPWDYDTWIPSMVLFSILDLFLLSFLLYLRQTSAVPGWRILYTLLALATFCWMTTDFLETLYYADVLLLESYGVLDNLWYTPWLLIAVAGRVRTNPVPGFLGVGGPKRALPSPEQMSRAGWGVVAALALPVIHFGAEVAGFLDPESRVARDIVVLVSLGVLLTLAHLHQRAIEKRAVALAWEKEDLEARRQLLAAVVEQAPDVILIASAQARVWYANRALTSTGQRPSDVMGHSLDSALSHAEPGPGGAPLEEALRAGISWEGRGILPGPDGRGREELVTVSPVRDGSGEVTSFVALRRDVTHRSRLERRIRQTQRMESLGALAGGLAHNFETLLATISQSAEILAGGAAQGSEEKHVAQAIVASAKEASGLVDRVLTFSQAGEGERDAVSVGPLVRDTLSLLRPSLPAGVEILDEVKEDAGTIVAVPRQIHEVVLNLGTRAINAMTGSGGAVQVWVDRVTVGHQRASALGLEAAGDYVQLTVKDSGPGLDPETVEHIFDPYFASDYPGGDAGLSLAVVHGVVQANGGAITVESQPRKGTMFQVYFPVAIEEEPRPGS